MRTSSHSSEIQSSDGILKVSSAQCKLCLQKFWLTQVSLAGHAYFGLRMSFGNGREGNGPGADLCCSPLGINLSVSILLVH